MVIHDRPKKKRRKKGTAAASPGKNAVNGCQISAGEKIHFELVVPDAVFNATITKPTACTLSTKGGDARRAALVFD